MRCTASLIATACAILAGCASAPYDPCTRTEERPTWYGRQTVCTEWQIGPTRAQREAWDRRAGIVPTPAAK